ncbi:RICIN domain-containing protein [Amycolatopsis sp. NPDC021455]|uniref:RICIN domain-containing protein n=1 Tax=Amycolatopsis sp. NPDC021455 TaxID=3154901 RepID=UPI0033E16573
MAIALAVGVPALVVPCLALTRDGSEPVQVDSAAYYQFVSARDDTALAVAAGDAADGARIQPEKRAAGAASQQWQLKPLGGGYCLLVNHNSGKVLGIRGSATAAADVEQQPDTGATTQQWQLRDVGGGAVKIVSRDGARVLSVTGGTDRRVVAQPADRGSADQRWNLAKAATPAKPAAPAVAAGGGTVAWTASGRVPHFSTDQGASWTVSAGLPSGATVVADRAAAGTFHALSGATLFDGTDGAKSFTARAGGLPHSTDGGASFSRPRGVQVAAAVGFGKSAPGASYPVRYPVRTVGGVTGIFRSADGGGAWPRVDGDLHQYGGGAGSGVITGDLDEYGRGVLYGEPS